MLQTLKLIWTQIGSFSNATSTRCIAIFMGIFLFMTTGSVVIGDPIPPKVSDLCISDECCGLGRGLNI